MNTKESDKNNIPALSKRLKTVADMVPCKSRIADVGTDHGFVPIYLAKSLRIEHAIAMDIRKGPLERAKQHVIEYGLTDLIETRLSDGLEKLCEDEADTMICAGMGGPLMQKILSNKDVRALKLKTLILEPQSEIMEFRSFLRENGFEITQEEFLLEDGKYYPVIKATVNYDRYKEESPKQCPNKVGIGDAAKSTSYLPKSYEKAIEKLKDISEVQKAKLTDETLLRLCDRFGPCIIMSPNEDFQTFLVHGKAVCDTILNKISDVKNSHTKRFEQVSMELSDIKTALWLF